MRTIEEAQDVSLGIPLGAKRHKHDESKIVSPRFYSPEIFIRLGSSATTIVTVSPNGVVSNQPYQFDEPWEESDPEKRPE